MIKQQVDVEEFVGWKDGIYVFKEKSLGEIMKTLERWYNISVGFQEKSLVDLPFTGNLKRYDDIKCIFRCFDSYRGYEVSSGRKSSDPI